MVDNLAHGLAPRFDEAGVGEALAAVLERRGVKPREVYQPLDASHSGRRVGVLELYLPYTPIAADISAGLHSLYVDLAIGSSPDGS